MYKCNLFTPIYLFKVFISRFALVGVFDYASTEPVSSLSRCSAQAQPNPPRRYRTTRSGAVGIAKVNAKPKTNAYKPVTGGYTRPLCVIYP